MAQHTPTPVRPDRTSAITAYIPWVVAGAVALVFVLVVGVVAFSGDGSSSVIGRDRVNQDVDVAALPLADTYAVIPGAPADAAIDVATDGRVVHPNRETPVHDAPDGTPIARVEPQQFGDVWFPVIAEQGDWVQVLLPSKPSRSTGWMRSADLTSADNSFRIEVHLGSRTIELIEDEASRGEWPVAIGTTETPTPVGRTFVLGHFTDPAQNFSPVILPLGVHSPTLDTFGGGPGTVAIHTWPDSSVFGKAVSNGCIRVPADALTQLTKAPLGTLVLIDQN